MQLILHLSQHLQASAQAAKLVSTIVFNSALYNYETLRFVLYYDAQCLMYYHYYHNLVHHFYRCQHEVYMFKLPVGNRQCPNRSSQYCSYQSIQYLI
jgi:hypothetical protein